MTSGFFYLDYQVLSGMIGLSAHGRQTFRTTGATEGSHQMNMLLRHIASLLFGAAVCSTAAAATDVSVVHSGNWAPYADEALPGHGLAIDLVTTALKRAGYNPKVTTASLEQILEGSKTGTFDVFATPWYTMDRAQYLDFSQPYLESSVHFIKRKDTPFEYTRFDDLEGVRIGVIKNYAYDEDFSSSPLIERIDAGSLKDNLKKLIAKEIDLTLDDERVLRYTLNQSTPDNVATLEILARPLATRGVNIGVSRNNPDHARIVVDFNQAIAEMKRDGTYSRIVQKYNAYIGKRGEGPN
jgi:polar amino acid transport system substrate-binding protein